MASVERFDIASGWHWKERDTSLKLTQESIETDWTPASTFPSEIHVELLKTGRIPDPYLEFNEHEVQCTSFFIRWVG
jgi:beta-mannosidase